MLRSEATKRSGLVSTALFLCAVCLGCGGHSSNAVAPITEVYSFGATVPTLLTTTVANGNVYVVTQNALRQQELAVFSDFGKGQETILSFPAAAATNGPIAVSPLNGDIYGPGGGGILAFTPTLRFIGEFQEPLSTKYTYGSEVNGVVVDSKGNVYEADGYNIVQFTAAGTYLSTIPVHDAGLGGTDDIAIDSSDNLYVGDSYTVTKFSPAGKLLERFSCSNIADDGTDIAVDGSGNIYTASGDSGIVVVYSPTGSVEAAQTDISPWISVDAAGNIYASRDQGVTVYHAAGS